MAMKHALIPMTAAALIAGAAAFHAAAAEPKAVEPKVGDPMAVFYGNTLIISVPAGYYMAQRYIDPDGTWREKGGVRGLWTARDGKVCNWQTEPAIVDVHHYCYPIEAHKVGETWTTTDPQTGNDVIQKIEAGRD